MSVSFWTQVISNMGTFFVSFYIFDRAVHYRVPMPKRAIGALWCFIWALLEAYSFIGMPYLLVRVLFCVVSIVFIWVLLKIKWDTIISGFLLSYGSSNILYSISAVFFMLVFAPFLGSGMDDDAIVDLGNPIYLLTYTLVATLQLVLAHFIFKVRRFRRGLPMLSGRYAVSISLIISGCILTVSSLLANIRATTGVQHIFFSLIAGVGIVGVGIIIWIRRAMKAYQIKRGQKRNEELEAVEIERLKGEIEHYKAMHETVREANHKMMHRQAATELNFLRLAEKARSFGLPAEFSEELSVMIDEVRELSTEYQDAVGTEFQRKLQSTNIPSTDALFELFRGRCAESGVDFGLRVKGSVVHMVENKITKIKMETMIADHIQDALNAVNASDGKVKSILAMIGEADGCYEFSVQDSGVPFGVDTLIRLGAERVTTRKDGSGIGFMTTFETMRETGASLIITETPPCSSFSKTVAIRFDGENRYIISTYRPDEIPPSDRHIVVDNR